MNWHFLFLAFTGRVGRRDFWIGAAALIVVGMLTHLLPLVGPIASLALLYPWTALMAKRLHDFDRPGWLVLVPVVPAAASGVLALFATLAMGNVATVGTAFATAGLALLVSTLAVLVGLGFVIWAGLKEGDARANRYGPIPTDLLQTS